jgi:hypothetical protein
MRAWICCLAALAAAGGCARQPRNPEAEAAATASAVAWLKLVDGQEYAASWNEASSLFRAAVEAERWPAMVGAIRGTMGRNVSREVESARFASSMPGAPDGEYVVIRFRSSFERKKTAVETVTPMKETNGQWRVSGYFIR